MADKKKPVRVTTPKGVAQWPNLQVPDTKFNEDGEYRTKLVIASGYEEFKEKLDGLLEESVALAEKAEAEKEKPGKVETNAPYEINEEGAMVLSFKCNAQYTSKKDGKVVKVKPVLVDGKGKPITKLLKIGSGSVIKVNFETYPYIIPAQPKRKIPATAGIGMRLKGVQLCKLVEWGSSMFGADEEAEYEYDEDDTVQEQEAVDGAEDSDEEDF